MSYRTISELPCGCKTVRGTCNCESAGPEIDSFERCDRHQKEFDREFAWDRSKGNWVARTPEFERNERVEKLKYLRNQATRLSTEALKAQNEMDDFKRKHKL